MALPSVAFAQADGDAEEADTRFDLGQITVMAQPADDIAIGSESVGREAIRAFQRNTLDDAASLIPGVFASNSGGSRNERLLFIRGFDRFQVPLSIDGIRVYLPADNRLDYGRFLTQDLAEIQVAKGYASVLDGPGAMGGAVNLVTRKPTKELEAEMSATLDLDRNADYAGYSAFGLLGTRQDKWYAQASFARNFTDHWDLPGGFEPTASEDGGERDLSHSEDWRLNAKIGFTPNADDEYVIGYTRQEGSKNAPLSTVDPASSQRNWKWPWWNIDSIHFLSRTTLSEGAVLKTRFYRNGFDNLLSAYDDATQTTQTRRRAFNSYYEDVAWGGSAELALALSAADRLSLALHYRNDKHVEFQQGFPSGDTEPEQHSEEDTWSIAAENRYAITPAVSLTLGASYDWRDLKQAEEYGEPAAGGDDVIFSYPLADADAFNGQGRLEWQASDDTSLHASVSSRARFPSLFERFSSRFGGAVSNPDLKAERATSFEIGGNTQAGILKLAGAVYYADLSDVIVSFPFLYDGQSVSQSRNVGDGSHYGFELSADAAISPTLSFGANYSYAHRDLDDPSETDVEPTGVPTHKGFAYADWRPLPGLRVLPSLEITSDRWTVTTDGTLYYRTGSYIRADLGVEYDVGAGVTLGARMRNAFDDYYVLTDGFPEAGRSFSLTARWRN